MATHKNSAQVLKGLLDAMVLMALSRRDNYGFAIYQEITARMGNDADLFKESSLYPLLHRLEAKGFVDYYWKPGDRGTNRKYYKITEAGKAHLNERVDDWLKVIRVDVDARQHVFSFLRLKKQKTRSPYKRPGLHGFIHPAFTVILRGFAFSALGSVNRSTPFSSFASIFS